MKQLILKNWLSSFLNFICLLVLFSLLSCQQTHVEWKKQARELTLGEAVYIHLYDNLKKDKVCNKEKLGMFDSKKAEFVTAFDTLISDNIISVLDDSFKNTMLPLIDEGKIPKLTDYAAKLINSIVQNPEDSDLKVLSQLISVFKARTILNGDDILDFLRILLDESNFNKTFHAYAQMAIYNDNGVSFAYELFSILARGVERTLEPINCEGLNLSTSDDLLLQSTELGSQTGSGEPAYCVYADLNGNPKVTVNSETETLNEPFVDYNQDFAADINNKGEPIDINGNPVKIPVFDENGNRDTNKRALANSGELLYEYFDASDTVLSYLLLSTANYLSTRMHHEFYNVVETAFGEPVSCGDNCLNYPVNDNPVADLVFSVVEDFKYKHIGTLLKTWSVVIEDDPQTAELVLISVYNIMKSLEHGGITLTDIDLLDFFIDILPLIAEIFKKDNSTGETTARLLLDVIHELGDVARDFPSKLLTSLQYVSLEKDETCSSQPPNLELSIQVNYERERYYYNESGLVDNRSGIEQLVELLADSDCGSVPFTGDKTVAEVIVENMADRTPDNVCDIINGVFGIIGFAPNVSEAIAVVSLNLMGCDGELVWDNLMSMDVLAKSGMLDAILPVAKSFVDRDQLNTLLSIFHLLNDDLKLDEGGVEESTVRKILPTLIKVLKTDAVDSLFDLDDILVSVPAVDGSGNLADVIVDSFEWVTAIQSEIQTRQGVINNKSHAIAMLTPYREIANRLNAAGKTENLQNLINYLLSYLEPQSEPDVMTLKDQAFLKVLEKVLKYLSEVLTLSVENQNCFFSSTQTQLNDFITHKDMATAVRLMRIYINSENFYDLDSFAVKLFTPNKNNPSKDLFASLVKILSAVIQIPKSNNMQFDALLEFILQLLKDPESDFADIISIIDTILLDDENDTFINIIRTAVKEIPELNNKTPVQVFAEILMNLLSIKDDNECINDNIAAWELNDIEQLLKTASDFLTDKETGLKGIYHIISLRSAPWSSRD